MADTLDVLTAAEAERAINEARLSDVSRASELPAYVTAASRIIDDLAGPVVRRDVTDERHDGGSHVVHLDLEPVYVVTTLTEYTGTSSTVLALETAGTEPANGFLPVRWPTPRGAYTGMLRRRDGGTDAVFSAGRSNIVATYTAGRYATTEAVDPLFKQACVLVLKNLWRAEQTGTVNFGEFEVPTQSYPTFAVPNVVRQMLADELVTRVGIA